ncbi:MAG: hypothetical protein AB1592_03870 [Pseudomonadota bacterium]
MGKADFIRVIKALYDRMAPLDGYCMEWAWEVSGAFPEAIPVGGYVCDGVHWWLEFDGEILDLISSEWEYRPTGPKDYEERARGREALSVALDARGA